MRRRNFVTMLGCAAAVWPRAANAQQPGRVRRVGVLLGFADDDPEIPKYLGVVREALRAAGWNIGQNLQIDHRAARDLDGMRARAAELIALGPDVVLTFATPTTSAMRQVARGTPIVFLSVSDPVGVGFVDSFARPGGTITGFTNLEPTMGSKWVELIRDIAPGVKRIAMLFDPATANAGATGGVYLASMKAATQALDIELVVSAVSTPAAIDEAFAAMVQSPGGSVAVMPNVFTIIHRERIVAQAARHRIPTVYPLQQFVRAGGLLSYGVENKDMFRRAASYADRILKGAKPADLPVQQPIKFELTINARTAAALGLTVPPALLVRADEVID